METIKKVFGVSLAIVSMAFLLYWLAMPESIDIIDDFIVQGMAQNAIPGSTAAVTLLTIETAVLVMVVLIGSIIAFKNARDFLVSTLSLPLAAIMVYVLSTGVMLFYPDFKFTADRAWLTPYLLAFYVLRYDGAYIFLLAGIFIVALVIVLKIGGVE
nr:hypothetical protein [Candidatus Sigynarchaeota archaeon]